MGRWVIGERVRGGYRRVDGQSFPSSFEAEQELYARCQAHDRQMVEQGTDLTGTPPLNLALRVLPEDEVRG
jgi:hypothetical protein